MDNMPRCDNCGEQLQVLNDFPAVFILWCFPCRKFWYGLTDYATNDPADAYDRSLIKEVPHE